MRLLPRQHVLHFDWLVHAMLYWPALFLLALVLDGAGPVIWAQALVIVGLGCLLWYGGMWSRPPFSLVFFVLFMGLGVWGATLHWTGALFYFYGIVFVMQFPRVWQASLALAGQTLVILAHGIWLDLGVLYLSTMAILIFLGGHADYLFFRHMEAQRSLLRSQEDIEHLGREAERERIARDLHDVLGHTLSSIALKAELAEKLAPTQPERAIVEMRQVAESARRALAEVRQTVTGYRSGSLSSELSLAKHALEAADVQVRVAAPRGHTLDRDLENVLCLALREAVTNVVRHAEARHCIIELWVQADEWRLTVEDDGKGWGGSFGNGLEGMRERLCLYGGDLKLQVARPGCRLVVTVKPSGRIKAA